MCRPTAAPLAAATAYPKAHAEMAERDQVVAVGAKLTRGRRRRACDRIGGEEPA